MIAKFSAAEARQTAEIVKQAKQGLRREAAALREQQALIQASIDQGWNAQLSLLMNTAVEGRTEICCDSVFKFKALLRMGLRVFEYGKVRKQSGVRNASVITKEIDAVKSDIFKLFDNFIDSSPAAVKKHYDSAADFHKLNYQELLNAMRIGSTDEFNCDSSYLDEFYEDSSYLDAVPAEFSFSAKCSTYLEKLNDKIRGYKKLGKELEIAKNFKDDYSMTSGDYEFYEDDKDNDILQPTNERNTFKIKWASDEIPDFMIEPLCTRNGLSWIASKNGQLLQDAIFECLRGTATLGKNSKSLKFKLTGKGWYFVNDADYHYPSCMPDDLVEIIARQDFIIADTSATSRSYTIKVKW